MSATLSASSITSLRTKKEMLASKHDIMALKDDIMRLENKLNDHLKWVMGAIIGMGGLIIAAFKLL